VKRLFVLFVILALAFIAVPMIMAESIGPPGITAAPIDFDAFLSPVAVQVPKEFNVVGSDAVLVSTSTAISGIFARDKLLESDVQSDMSLGAVA
jgi:hypothetical protein